MSNLGSTIPWTQALNTPLVVTKAFYAMFITLLVESGTCQILGAATINDMPSTAITLSAGQSYTIASKNSQSPLDGITITPVGGVTSVMIQQ